MPVAEAGLSIGWEVVGFGLQVPSITNTRISILLLQR
jgi:hypothetical protein